MNKRIKFYCVKCGIKFDDIFFYEEGLIILWDCDCGARTIIKLISEKISICAINEYKKAYNSRKREYKRIYFDKETEYAKVQEMRCGNILGKNKKRKGHAG